MKKMEALLKRIELVIPLQEKINNAVSQSSVGWHIEHSLLTINLIIEGLKISDPKDYKWKLNLSRMYVFTFNKIPRGRAKAPKVVVPKEFDTGTLKKHLEKARFGLVELSKMNPASYFVHPYFGKLNKKQTIKFLAIHTGHHLAIMDDIIGLK